MEITSLAYLGLRTSRLAPWEQLATRLLGLQPDDRSRATRAFRMDERCQRIVLEDADAEGVAFIGWEVAQSADLDALAARLDALDVRVAWGGPALCAQRHVERLIAFADPGGNPLEVVWRPAVDARPFVAGRPLSGFRTGALGMGHVVLHVDDIDRLMPFYRDVLGFRITDYGLAPYKLYFLHVNDRHHSLAMIGTGRQGLHHFMIELCSLDDVGQAYDIAQLEPGRLAYTLGRHLNDQVTSFYVNTPSGFFVEYGWGGLVLDRGTWQPHETVAGPSSWGHDRLYDLPVAQREHLLKMRLDAAANGIRAPDPVAGRPRAAASSR